MIMFEYSLEKSFDELCNSVDDVKKDTKDHVLMQEVHFRLGTCLHWLVNSWERIKQSKIIRNEDHNLYFSAFEHANNQLKHYLMLAELSQVSIEANFSFPTSFSEPHMFGKTVFKWVELKSKKHEKSLAYQKFLQGKDIIETLQQGKDIVFNCFDVLTNKMTSSTPISKHSTV